jgi:hypothetical protein
MIVRNGQKLGSVLVDEESEAEADETPQDATEPTEALPAEPEVKPSKALSKDELVTLAESAGLGTREELEQFTKQDLVDELKAHEEG